MSSAQQFLDDSHKLYYTNTHKNTHQWHNINKLLSKGHKMPEDQHQRLIIIAIKDHLDSEHSSRCATREQSELYGREYDQGKVTYNHIYFQQKSLCPIFFPFSSRKLSSEVDRTGAILILISIMKCQETSVNKCHEHILLIIFITCIYY